MTTKSLIATMLLLGTAMPTLANIRAPKEFHYPPSSALYHSEMNLTVQKEKLTFLCDEQACDVTATYYIKAPTEQELVFEFILPANVNVSARVGNAGISVQTISVSKPLDDREKDALLSLFSNKLGQLFKANFRGILHRGINDIQVKYIQPLSAIERDYGYFKEGQFVKYLQYELWPLKEWHLSEDFNLELVVKMKRMQPNWWKRTFGTVRSMSCSIVRFRKCDSNSSNSTAKDAFSFCKDYSFLPKNPIQQGEYLVLTTSLDQNLPERLICEMGDNDLLAR